MFIRPFIDPAGVTSQLPNLGVFTNKTDLLAAHPPATTPVNSLAIILEYQISHPFSFVGWKRNNGSDWVSFNPKRFTDDSFKLLDQADATKIGAFDVSLISVANTRTLQFPDKNGIIATIADLKKPIYWPVDWNSNLGNGRARSIGGSGGHRFNFVAPSDLTTVSSIDLIFVPNAGAAGSGKAVDYFSNYGQLSQSYLQHQESNTGNTFNLGTVDQYTALDVKSLFPDIAPGDHCNLFVDHKGIGGTVYYQYIRFVYS